VTLPFSFRKAVSDVPISMPSTSSICAIALGGVSPPSSTASPSLFLALSNPGPIGPSSTLPGTKALILNSADVGDTVPFKRTIGEACLVPDVWGNGWFGEERIERGVVEGVERVGLRVGGSEGVDGSENEFEGKCVVGVCAETAGDSTISPQSSSSSLSSLTCGAAGVGAASVGGLVSRAPRVVHGSAGGPVWSLGGEMEDSTGASAASLRRSVLVAVLLCDEGSFGRELRSIDTGRVPCRCNVVTVPCLGGATGEDTARTSPTSSLHGSPPAEGELQSNAAGTSVSNFGTLSLATLATGFDTETDDLFLA